jgi:cobalamin biosynthesis Mg chelatase CobN
MRTRISLLAIVVAGVCAASALAASPAQIYSDYVSSGRLSCSYSRGDLEALLRSGSINQYGDPFTLARLKLAARRHLAGSCQKASAATTAAGGAASTSTKQQTKQRRSKRHPDSKRPQQQPKQARNAAHASASGDNSSFIAGRGLIVGLLAVALALGGWLTKRALSARD